MNTLNVGVKKILHWFDWSKKIIHLFDVYSKTHEAIDLQMSFDVPNFSRSVVNREGEIFLIGGEG